MSSVVPHQSETKRDAVAIATVQSIARNQRNISVHRINRNHHQMTVHSVRSKATHRQRTADELSDRPHHQVMQMVN